MYRFGLIMIILFLFLSCSDDTQDNFDNGNEVDIEQKLVDKIKDADSFLDLFELEKEIELKLPDGKFISGITNFKYYDKQKIILVFSSKDWTLHLFDIQGNYIFSLNANGQGPEEYNNVKNYELTDENIVVEDNENNLIVFDQNGKFKKKVKLQDVFMKEINTDNIIVNDKVIIPTPNYFDKIEEQAIIVYDYINDKIISRYGKSLKANFVFFPLKNYIFKERYYLYTMPFHKNIYQIDIKTGEEKIFCEIKGMTEEPNQLKNAKSQEDVLNFMNTQTKIIFGSKSQVFSIFYVKGLVFLEFRFNNNHKFEIMKENGNNLKSNCNYADLGILKKTFIKKILNDYDIDESRSIVLYSNGIILNGYSKEQIKNINYNPYLLFLKFK